MGIQGFYTWAAKHLAFGKIKNQNQFTISYKKAAANSEIDELYIDANSIIHNSLHKLISLNISDDAILSQLIDYTLEKLKQIIENWTPTKLLYISFDGVPPFAKINKQKIDYIKGTYERQLISFLSRTPTKRDINYFRPNISNGTIFMQRLNETLEYEIDGEKHGFLHDNISKIIPGVQIIYSSVDEPGEGEHKIIQYIKNHSTENNKYIYSPDADVIFLLLLLPTNPKNHIYYMKDSFEKEDEMYQIDINDMKDNFYKFICLQSSGENKEIQKKLNIQNVINDITFLSIIIGNDFIPHSQLFTFTNNNSINTLFNIYLKELYEFNNKKLNSEIQYLTYYNSDNIPYINNELFKQIFIKIGEAEKILFKDLLKDIQNISKFNSIYERTTQLKYSVHIENIKKKIEDFKNTYIDLIDRLNDEDKNELVEELEFNGIREYRINDYITSDYKFKQFKDLSNLFKSDDKASDDKAINDLNEIYTLKNKYYS